MTTSIHILHLEDNTTDAELIHATLTAADILCDTVRVEGRADFIEAVERGGFDLILADYNLPSFDGVSALAIARRKCPEIPFIFVTGSLGEERAIETLKNGATDYVLKNSPGRLVPAVVRAMEEVAAQAQRKRLEDQLRHAQKMESIGTLAGGVAHDFNNLLTAIIGNAQLALAQIQPEDPLHERLIEIENSGRRAAELTRQLLIFSRRERLEPKPIDLNDTIDQFVKMLRRIIGEDVELRFHPTDDLSTVFADPGQMEQVLMNLVCNARDAMPDGGELIIETRNITVEEMHRRTHPIAGTGAYVQITVTDSGAGMNAETQQHIFEPFFTTKEVGKGTGLGLALVYGIIDQHEGTIEVTSEVGRGTTFRICLPAQEEAIEDPVAEAEPALRGGAETILVAEDEESLQRLLKGMLTGLGYKVILTPDGETAVEAYSSHSNQIDLVILDMVMPRMGGREAYERIRTLRNDVPVLFMTGYSAEMAQTRFVSETGAAFIQKPYGIAALSHKVREALDARALA
jgi:two-component system cell cycle sensor histidine kinase/response regulator CckA